MAHLAHVAWNACAWIGIVAIIFVAALAVGDRAAARGWNPFE